MPHLSLLSLAGYVVSIASSVAAETTQFSSPAAMLLRSLDNPETAAVLQEVLGRNPEIAAARAQAAASAQVAPQAGSLPDPTAAFTLYLQTPETRVGPQHGMISVSQRIPWFGTLGVREKAAVADAAAAAANVAALELEKISDGRVILQELRFLDLPEEILREEVETLDHFEELARARYASGLGLEQAPIKIQAEIARKEAALLELEAGRAHLVARVNRLRDRIEAPVPSEAGHLPERALGQLTVEELRAAVLSDHPQILGALARLQAAEHRVELAEKAFGPELTAGITYSDIGSRSDADPLDEGEDVLGVTGAVSLPIWRKRLRAGVEEALQARVAAEERVRSAVSFIEEEIARLTRRLPLIAERVSLFEGVLVVQAEESLSWALAAYSAGTADALDLLDAERVMGGNYIDVDIDREAGARFGLTVGDVQDVISTAIGGMNVHWTVEGLERYPINVRYPRELRDNVQKLGEVLVPAPTGAQVSLSQVATIRVHQGPPAIKSEKARPNAWVYVDLGTSDVGGWAKHAQEVVEQSVEIPEGYTIF